VSKAAKLSLLLLDVERSRFLHVRAGVFIPRLATCAHYPVVLIIICTSQQNKQQNTDWLITN